MSKAPSLKTARFRTPGQNLKPDAAPPPDSSAKRSVKDSVAPVGRKKKRPLKERSKQMVVYINPEAHKQLRQLAASEERLLNDLTVEALNLLFKARQLPQVAAPSEE